MQSQRELRAWRRCLFPAQHFHCACSTQHPAEYAVDLDFDTVSLEYAWEPAPDSKQSAQCAMTYSCEACMETFMRWCSLEEAWI